MNRSAWGLDRAPEENFARLGPCSQTPDLWTSVHRPELARAMHLCLAHCPVLDQCRRWVQSNPGLVGGQVVAGRWYRDPAYVGCRVGGHIRPQPTRECHRCVPDPAAPARRVGAVTAQQTVILTLSQQGLSSRRIAALLGHSQSAVSLLLRRHRESAGGRA